MNIPVRRLALLTAIAIAVAASLSGCSQAVTVQSDFPAPLVNSMPLTVGLRYDAALSQYTYREKVPNDSEWSFDLGSANENLFDTVFVSLFAETVRVENLDAAAAHPDLDAVIAPEIEALEFSLPRHSQSDQYSVWIRYNLNVYQPDGVLITKWPISAYGQSDSRTFGANDAMERATIQAMRDAAATITLGFAQQPQIKAALLEEAQETDQAEETNEQ